MENKFIVNCERIPRRQAYYLSFPINDYLIDKIRNLPEGTRKWNSQIKSWELTTVSLLALIKQFKGSDKIFFSFGSEANRLVFKNQITKIEEGEREKLRFIAELNIKKEQWVKYKAELEESYEKYSDKCHSFLSKNVKLYKHQIVAALFMDATRNTLISHEMGMGKANPLSTNILTPNGWVRMGDIKINNFVIGSDGKPKKVLGVFPQGVRKSYKVSFNDGTSVECSDEHIWAVRERKNFGDFHLKTVNELIGEELHNSQDNGKYYIPIVKPIEFERKTQIFDPYRTGYEIMSGGFKTIPLPYKFGSVQQRLTFLKGVLDKNKKIRDNITNILCLSKEFSDDIQFIVESLGGTAKINEHEYSTYSEIKHFFEIIISLPIEIRIELGLGYKSLEHEELPNRSIDKIEYVGDKECQCILIDSEDHLYCTEHCILTHNTLSSILYSEMNNFNKVVVITPNSLKHNFIGEIHSFTLGSTAHIVNWKKNTCSIENAKYIIMNYDFFNTGDKKKFQAKWNKLNIGKIDAVICDEATKLKNSESNTYKNFKKTFTKEIFKNEKVSKIFLSGTPMSSHAFEIYNLMHEISPLDFGTKKYFYSYYCGMEYNFGTGWGYVKNDDEAKLEELYYKIAPYTHRKRKIDTLDLPDKVYQKIILEMSDSENKIYEEIENNVANEIVANPNNNALTTLIRLRQYTSHLKIKCVLELIESIMDTGEKIVIVDMFKESLYELKEKLGNISCLHTGNQSVEERAEMVKDFQDPNSDVKIFLGSIQTCSYGLTLTAANKMFILSLPFTVAEYQQVTDRIHRISQKNNVTIYPMIFDNTIDSYVFSIIENKTKEIVKVMDNENYESNVDESVLGDVIKKIKEKHKK